jgi:hypothetical protein
MKLLSIKPTLCFLLTGALMTMNCNGGAASLKLGKAQEFVALPENTGKTPPLLDVYQFKRVSGTCTWVSDIEHVVEKHTQEIFLADTTPAYVMARDTVPANQNFELFPYHYYGKDEVEKLGRQISYRLACRNLENTPVTLEVYGVGTTTEWDQGIAWELALRNNGKKTLTLQPGEEYTFWREDKTRGDYPWSGIIFGKASGKIEVCDYAWQGDKDPGWVNLPQMPDLALEPYHLASFSRGMCSWNAADMPVFPDLVREDKVIALSRVNPGCYSVAFAYSPGGPLNKLCEYKVVDNFSSQDEMQVLDPLSGKSHVFFGGNYPAIYRFNLPLKNDTKQKRTISFYLCSNDKYNVDTLAGVDIAGKFLKERVLSVNKNQHWRVFTLTLKPGESYNLNYQVVPLGSRWGGMIGSLEFK